MKNKVQPYYPYPASMRAGELMDLSYKRMADYLNVEASEIHFGPSTTQNVYVLANAMRPMCKDGDEIIVSCQDHEANTGAWRRLADRGLKIVEWHVDRGKGIITSVGFERFKNIILINRPIHKVITYLTLDFIRGNHHKKLQTRNLN